MIKIPYEHIIERIKKEGKISEDEINLKIDAKMKQLSGLISKEGAAHIIANELGIKLFENFSGKLQIKNIIVGLRSVETIGKVTQTYELREFTTISILSKNIFFFTLPLILAKFPSNSVFTSSNFSGFSLYCKIFSLLDLVSFSILSLKNTVLIFSVPSSTMRLRTYEKSGSTLLCVGHINEPSTFFALLLH